METDNPSTYSPGYGKFYVTGNIVTNSATVTTDNWNGGIDRGSGLSTANFNLAKMTNPFTAQAITVHTAQQAYDMVLLYAGASYKRDAVDARVINETKNGTNTFAGSKTGKLGIIDSQTDVGSWPTLNQTAVLKDTDGDGMPDEWEIANKLDPTKANANGRDLSSGYDNIEVYINSLVKTITEAQYK
ncbi:MAG: hypothetical protein EOO07_36880 [Chitinophagaceae bacterium]|nr:MAG: hypothetical protein EOO07_36880 [Chitinophagaceae bacterium]